MSIDKVSVEKFKTIYGVENLMHNVPEAANNTNLLVALYWHVFDNIDLLDLAERIGMATPIETILRARREINSKYNSQ
jgi:hypothetical protein